MLPRASLLLAFCALITSSLAAIGGGDAGTAAATQQPPTMSVNSIYTIDGTTYDTYVAFTQTFASSALGTWAIGATPLVGSIGLGDIEGTVGAVKNGKRAVQTAAP